MTEVSSSKLIVILGPTASGKTRLAVRLASHLHAEIISADSRQVYRGMDIGTGKDLQEYLPYFSANDDGIEGLHLVNIMNAGESYHLAAFQRDCQKAVEEIIGRNKTPIICGGTGLYVEAFLRNFELTQVPINQDLRGQLLALDKEELLKIFIEKYQKALPKADISTAKRLIRAIETGNYLEKNPSFVVPNTQPIYEYFVFGLNPPTEQRRQKISARLRERLANGMIEEVQSLIQAGVSPEKLIFYGLEYKFITEYLMGNSTYESMVSRLETAIHQFAKRQMTFFRSMERKGLQIHWLDPNTSIDEKIQEILAII